MNFEKQLGNEFDQVEFCAAPANQSQTTVNPKKSINTKMNIRNTFSATGLLISMIAPPSWAQSPPEAKPSKTTIVDIAGHKVPVVAGGLYYRYRSNPPLSVIQSEAPDVDLSWFKGIPKVKTDMGFESFSPNFYYKNSRVTAIFTADFDRLKALIPAEVLKEIQPLQVWPGRGLVVVTGYAYHYCDNDSYNEVGISIVTSKPRNSNWGPLTLLGQATSKDFWGYVTKLPVNTELARVRGAVGYNLPKWLTEINLKESNDKLVFKIYDSHTGKIDVTFEAKKLEDLSDKVELVTHNFTNLNKSGHLTTGYAVSRQLSHASSSSSDSFKLILGEGNLSDYLKSLKLGRMVKYEYVPNFQSALYAPKAMTIK